MNAPAGELVDRQFAQPGGQQAMRNDLLAVLRAARKDDPWSTAWSGGETLDELLARRSSASILWCAALTRPGRDGNAG